MKVDALVRYEIQAEAFHSMTGKMAPGKSVSPEFSQNDTEERLALWCKWHEDHREVIDAFMWAISEVLP